MTDIQISSIFVAVAALIVFVTATARISKDAADILFFIGGIIGVISIVATIVFAFTG